MSLNDIVVYVDSAEATKSRVEFAVALAKDHGAHLLGVAFAPTALLPLYGADVGFADMSEVLQGVKAQGETALQAFKACARSRRPERRGAADAGHERGIPARLRLLGAPRRPRRYRPAPRRRPADRPICPGRALPVRLGRPVIIVPSAADEPRALRGTVVAAWDGSAEAARAFNDALTFLKPAKRVVLLVGVAEDAGERASPRSTTWSSISSAAASPSR